MVNYRVKNNYFTRNRKQNNYRNKDYKYYETHFFFFTENYVHTIQLYETQRVETAANVMDYFVARTGKKKYI